MNKHLARVSLALLSFLSLGIAVSAQNGTYAITNAKIVTVAGSTIESGTVVIRDGLIEAVGPNAKVPADARVIDGKGLTVYPGIFDTSTKLGIPAAQPPQPGARGADDPSNSIYPDGLRPEVSAASKIKAGEAQFTAQRNNGITTVLSVDDSGIFNGQSVVINLAGESAAAMILKAPFAQHISFQTVRGSYPGSLMGTFAALRQMLLDAKRLQMLQREYEQNPAGMKRPEADASLEALYPVLNGEQPVVFNASSEREIIRALDLAEEFSLVTIISGGLEAWKVTDRLKKHNATVLLSLNLPKRTLSENKEAEPESLETLRFRAAAPKNAAKLKEAGVRFAFHSGELKNLKEFYTNAAEAVENGLSKDDAIRAMTMTPAEILGVAKQLGSVEAGKIANLVVVKGDLFDKDSSFTHVFVDGKMFEQPKKPERPAGNAAGAPGAGTAPLQLAGTWNVVVLPPGQSVDAVITFTQQGSVLNGTLSSSLFPSTPIRDGKASPTGFTFSATVAVGGTEIDVFFDGRVTGNSVEGTVDTVQGPAVFSGTKVP